MDIENMPSINDEEAPNPGEDPVKKEATVSAATLPAPKPEPAEAPPPAKEEKVEKPPTPEAPAENKEEEKSKSKSLSQHSEKKEKSVEEEPQSKKSEKSVSKRSVSKKSESKSKSQKTPHNDNSDISEGSKEKSAEKTLTSATKSTVKKVVDKLPTPPSAKESGRRAPINNQNKNQSEPPQSRSSRSSKTKRSSYTHSKTGSYSSQERSSEPHSDDSYQGKEENRGRSSKQSSTYRPKKDKNNKNNKKESESAPTYACAETTPSCAESTPVVVIKQKKKPKKSSGKKKEEYYTESDNSMVSVSSGLESLRDIFFDHNDSHKGYLAHYPNASHDRSDETYQSHNLNEAMSRISNPSFNSHVDLTKLSICEDVKSPEHTAPTTEVTNIEPHTNPEMLSTISEHVTQENKPPTPKLTPVRDLLSPELDYLTDVEDGNYSKHVDFQAGSNLTSLSLDHTGGVRWSSPESGRYSAAERGVESGDHSQGVRWGNPEEHYSERYSPVAIEQADLTDSAKIRAAVDEMCSEGHADNIISDIDRKYLSFTSNSLLCDLSNIVPSIQNIVKIGSRHILNKEVCLEFMCWLENLNQLYMSSKFPNALDIFKRQESRFKIVLYECLQVAQGCGLDIGFERVAAMAHMSLDIIYTMLPYCDGIKWYSQMVAGARRASNKLAEAYMLMCMGQLMIYNGDSFEAQKHLQTGLSIVKTDFMNDKELYNCLKHLTGFSVAMCDCNDVTERERGLIKMTESLVMTRNVYGSNSLETAMGRLHIGIAYKALYEDTTLRLEGLDYVERAHEVLEDKLGHHPYMGICVQTLAQYHDAMLSMNFSSEYNQAVKCYNLAVKIHETSLGGHSFTVRALTLFGDFYHRMADYRMAGKCLSSANTMATEYSPTDVVYAHSCFQLGLYYMDEQCTEHDIYRGQGLLTSAANLLSKYGVTYQRATMLFHMGIASEEAGLRYTLYKQESDNIKATMFGANQQTGANIKNTVRAKQVV